MKVCLTPTFIIEPNFRPYGSACCARAGRLCNLGGVLRCSACYARAGRLMDLCGVLRCSACCARAGRLV